MHGSNRVTRSRSLFLVLVLAVVGWGGKCGRSHRESIERMNLGVEYYQRDQFSEAVRMLQEAIALEPDNVQAHHNLAIVHMKQENWRLASQSLSRAIELEPSVGSYHHELGETYQRLNQHNEARQALERAIQLEPSLFKPYYELGLSLEELDDQQNALRRYTECVERNSLFPPCYSRLGSLYDDLGYLEEAVQVYEQALRGLPEATPELADIHVRLGVVYQQMGHRENNNPQRMTQAVEQFRTALRLNPASSDALFGLGMTYQALSNREEARVFLRRFVETAGTTVPAHYRTAAQMILAGMQESPQL